MSATAVFRKLIGSDLLSASRSVRLLSTASSPRRLEGKVAVVTASTEGIGYAVAKRLGEEGAHVVISSRKQKNVDSALQKLRDQNLDVSGMVCHVGKTEDRQKLIDETVKAHGGLDILVSNAAVNPIFGPMVDTTSEDAWDKIFDTNVKSAFFLVKAAVPHMVKRGGGSIIVISSIAGYVPFDLLGAYSVSKTALLGLVKSLANGLGTDNIRVNGIAPGIIKTNFSTALWDNPAVGEEFLKSVPLKRFGEVSECAGLAAFLASDDSSYMTGENIVLAGGAPAKL